MGARDHKMGQGGAWTADVSLSDVRVAAGALIGTEPTAGYATAMRSLAHGRLTIAGVCVGVAGRLVEESTAYARQRQQGGRPIGDYQLVQAMLADSYTEYAAAAPWSPMPRRPTRRARTAASAPPRRKYFASEAVGRIADRACDPRRFWLHPRRPVERLYRDVRLFRIYEGTSQIQQLVIARELLR